MIHPLLPNQLQKTQETMRMAAEFILRPISRKYDKAEHEPPVEMEQLNEAAAAQKDAGIGDDSVKSMDLKEIVVLMSMACRNSIGLVASILIETGIRTQMEIGLLLMELMLTWTILSLTYS